MITDKMMLLAAVIVNNLSSSNKVLSVVLDTELGGHEVLIISTEGVTKRYEWDKHTESFIFRRNFAKEVCS